MSLLTDHAWRLKYTPDDGDLVRLLYVPALRASVRYDRLTGYFSANALALAARGVEGLVVNGGRMRLIVGCTLDQAEVEAISRGEALRAAVERRMHAVPLDPVHPEASDALELLAWMVAEGVLDVIRASRCSARTSAAPPVPLARSAATEPRNSWSRLNASTALPRSAASLRSEAAALSSWYFLSAASGSADSMISRSARVIAPSGARFSTRSPPFHSRSCQSFFAVRVCQR